MARNKFLANCLLYPASRLYGLGVGVRNMMFRLGVFKRRKFDIPVIVIGNIAAGGTGKTPHTEYITALLRSRYHLGVLSRGYGRSTSGYRQVTRKSTPSEVGDEPYQMFHKYGGPSVFFAVCEDRVKGIERMLEDDPKIDMILLDDAFQHRYVDPDIAIVLTEFGRPVFYDYLLPYGRLREPVDAISGADMVIVTKCPDKLKPLEYRIFQENLKLFHYQKLFFSHFVYREPVPLFPDCVKNKVGALHYLDENDAVLAVPGIGNPRPFINYLKTFKATVKVKIFSDHHIFTKKDFEIIRRRFEMIQSANKIIMTTEKDAVRLINNPDFLDDLKPYIYFIPIEVSFKAQSGDSFDESLMKLIRDASVKIGKSKTV